MNTQELKQHAERLLSAIANAEEAEIQIDNIKKMPYYDIFGTKEEQDKDISDAVDLHARCLHTIEIEMNIGQMILNDGKLVKS